ncbi:GNAT family N-acetyltransferase [Microbacterium sp. NPDC057407]|uniref:GNAT family N-acetyltransferase n=1 Tax=Microbacterium sp. NPDC057407 TaxID=3346120 RepID=UPI00366F3410
MGEFSLRRLAASDLEALTAAYRRNRDALAEWEPLRDEVFFTDVGQEEALRRRMEASDAGIAAPYVILRESAIVGLFNIGAIERGAFSNGRLGYWVDDEQRGRGLATWAIGALVDEARTRLSLHRLEAATLLHNVPSQRALRSNGFEEIGHARAYLQIAGRWQDHILFQRIL